MLLQSYSFLCIFSATSGDTGSAALEAVSVVEGCSIVVLLPRDRISAVQELQMITVIADNCHVIRGQILEITCVTLFNDS